MIHPDETFQIPGDLYFYLFKYLKLRIKSSLSIDSILDTTLTDGLNWLSKYWMAELTKWTARSE